MIAIFASLLLPIIPMPVTVEPQVGTFHLTSETSIVAPTSLQGVAERLRESLQPATGFRLPIVRHTKGSAIVLLVQKERVPASLDSYTLDVGSNGVRIIGRGPSGVFYGVQTLRQLFPVELARSTPSSMNWDVPAVHIEDSPRFSWRGAHLDVSRHFMPKAFVLRFIDLISSYKLNTLHFHLTDDQGWRIEIKRYPKLTQIGSKRDQTMAGRYDDHKFDGKPVGGFYTQRDIREIVKYASDRFVNVVPEIEMPGHSQAAIASYPELGNTTKTVTVGTGWGVFTNVYNVKDSTIKFLQNVIDEVMQLFPSKFIHLGGDEVPKDQWKASPEAQAKMKRLGLKDEDALQSWFMAQMDRYLASKGRRMVGWDEILDGGLAPGATVMSWRGEEGGIAAAKAGHDVVMTPGAHTYFDQYQSKDHTGEPLAIGGYLPLSTVYEYEPVPQQLTEAQGQHVLGAQGQLWTEYILNPRHVEYMAFPRFCALAEVVWSPKSSRDYQNFLARLKIDLQRLRIRGVNYRTPDEFR